VAGWAGWLAGCADFVSARAPPVTRDVGTVVLIPLWLVPLCWYRRVGTVVLVRRALTNAPCDTHARPRSTVCLFFIRRLCKRQRQTCRHPRGDRHVQRRARGRGGVGDAAHGRCRHRRRGAGACSGRWHGKSVVVVVVVVVGSDRSSRAAGAAHRVHRGHGHPKAPRRPGAAGVRQRRGACCRLVVHAPHRRARRPGDGDGGGGGADSGVGGRCCRRLVVRAGRRWCGGRRRSWGGPYVGVCVCVCVCVCACVCVVWCVPVCVSRVGAF
jgi:hypothetical protein